MNPSEFEAHSPVESGGAPPQSMTLARWLWGPEDPPGFGVRRCCGALDLLWQRRVRACQFRRIQSGVALRFPLSEAEPTPVSRYCPSLLLAAQRMLCATSRR